MTIAGREIIVPVISLDFDAMSIVSEELQEYMRVSLKDRKMAKDVPKLLQKSASKRMKKMGNAERQSRFRLAQSGFAAELEEGLQQDLQKLSRLQDFQKIRFVANGKKKKSTKKIK